MPAALSAPIAARIRLSRREKVLIAAVVAVVIASVPYLWNPASEEGGVELVARPAPPPLSLTPAAAPPPPLQLQPASPRTPAASPEGIVLKGVMGGGSSGGAAVLLLKGGQERTVRVGRDIEPGLTLKEIGVFHAIVAAAGGDYRIELNRSGAAAVGTRAAAPAAAAPASTGEAPSRERLALHLGMSARRANGNVTGYLLKPEARIPLLARAGLKPGDVLIAVNGEAIDGDERLLAIPTELAGAASADIEYERDGQRQRTQVPLSGGR